jgi:glycosyltransferase involved in cell wall biosynthesis
VKNEEWILPSFLAAVSEYADHIILGDHFSTDRSVEIAKAFDKVSVVNSTESDFSEATRRNQLLSCAREFGQENVILSIDADERVTPVLKQELIDVLAAPTCDGYFVPRLSELCGQPIRHSGWWPDYVLRLFRRGSGCFTEAIVHERVEINGPTAKLHSCLLHYPYETLDALINKVNRYSTDAAQMMFARGKRAGVLSIVGHSVWTFVRIYLLRRGFLDGRYGFVLAVTAASGSFFRYSKLMMLSRAHSANIKKIE